MTASWGRIGAVCAWTLAFCLAFSSTGSAYTVKHTGYGAVVRWYREAVTLRIDVSMDEYFRDLRVQSIVEGAAAAWKGLPGVPEVLVNAGEPDQAGFAHGGDNSNGVYLVKDWVLTESSLAVTVATFESRSGRIVDTDILVNANYPFGVVPEGPGRAATMFDLTGVLTHEMGHVLGLGESFDVRAATMWPNIARGEIHQRDLDDDDMRGVEQAYEGPMLADAEGAGGCGGASVVLKRPNAHDGRVWILTGLMMLGAGLWLRTRRARERKALSALGLVLLFAAPFEHGIESESGHERVSVLRTLALRRMAPHDRRAGLKQAIEAPSIPVRMAAAGVLERAGTREDLDLATKLALDSDADVRSAGTRALSRLRTAPPATRLEMNDPEAARRVQQLLAGAREIVSGEVVQVSAEMRKGLVWSRFLVHGEERVVELEIPGGTVGELTQVVSEQELPDDGEQLLVALRTEGRHAWAHLRDGVIYGGFLGEGPAIEWADP